MTKARILILDAFHENRESPVSVLLQANGYAVQAVDPRNEPLAVDPLSTDLVIIYHVPPEFDALKALKMLPQGQRPPIILIALQLDTSYVLSALRAGVEDCLTIPTDKQHLLDTVDRVLHSPNRTIEVLYQMAQHASEAILAFDSQNNLLFCNSAARPLLSDSYQHAVPGQSLADAISHPILQGILSQSDVAEAAKRTEITIEETQQTMQVQVTPIPGRGRLAILQDVTHLKEVDRIKSEFVERVSRDIRSPLTTIQGYVELIERMGPVNEQQKQFINRISFAVHSITALLSDLLELGRIEAGFEADQEPTHFAMVLRYALDGAQQQLTRKQLQLEVTLPEETSTVMGNPLRLRQMIDSLLDNAIKFTPESGTIRVTLSVQDTFLVFQIADSGIGIPPGDQPHVFEKFYRASNTREHFKGTGLGLSIVKGIVDKHNGRIWLESHEGAGTQFTIMLPIQSGRSEVRR